MRHDFPPNWENMVSQSPKEALTRLCYNSVSRELG
jgi:hypothetical protein